MPVAKSEAVSLPRDKNSVAIELSLRLSKDQIENVPHAVRQDEDSWKDGILLWSPEHPHLYDITIRLIDDSTNHVLEAVKTTTGMRSIDWQQGDSLWRLNEKPYFQALCLDQGYWPDSFMTASSAELRRDIEPSRKMGFNGCRKHQKVENPLFYYWADRLG